LGLGIGDWGLGIGPNPQSPIPNLIYYSIIENNNKIKSYNLYNLYNNILYLYLKIIRN